MDRVVRKDLQRVEVVAKRGLKSPVRRRISLRGAMRLSGKLLVQNEYDM